MWDDQVTAFSARYQMIRYDARGFGRSSPAGSTSYSSVDDLYALLRYLNVERATVIGLSMGGGIASAFAVTYPSVTRALVLVDALIWGYRGSSEWGDFLTELRQVARASGVAAARERWLSHQMFAAARARPEVIGRARDIAADFSGWHWLNRDPERWINPPTIERLGDIRCPTLVVVGGRDAPDFLGTADVLARQIPSARKVVLPGVGHLANLEAPAELNRAVLSFLSETREN
jgi:pimeloyl-ACP methyl ester carboxylesterase